MLLCLITLAASLLVVAIVGSIAFLDVAFHPPQYSAAVGMRSRSRPLRERELFQWCSATARRMACGWIAARRDRGLGRRAAELQHNGVETAGIGCTLEPVNAACCSTMLGVTPPEVREIVDYVRQTQPANRVDDVFRRAVENSREIAAMIRANSTRGRVRCPLACDVGTCIAYPVQPTQCRVRCALFGHEVGEDTDADRAHLIVDATEHGLSRAITEAGLGAQLYELNSALAKGLSLSDNAERSPSEDNPFEECLPYAAASMH